ncbi:MAG: PqqD family protein [Armatimonadetes bacterium]|nr:PqqD family protein [Armatimonadota bacterium]
MRLFTRRPQFTRRQIRKARPVRNPNLEFEEQEDGSILLRVPMESRGGVFRVVSRFLPAPGEKEVELEPVGAFVWRLCDGKHTCAGIAGKLEKEFKITKLEAEASLMAFLETLAGRRYVTLEIQSK